MNTPSFLKRMAISTLCCGLGILSAAGQVTLRIDAGKRGALIGERHYGIFFEEINHAGDGGLYAELIQNRSFEDNASTPAHWQALGRASLNLISDDLLNDTQKHALQVKFTTAGDGICNEGYWGINVVEGRTYTLSLWAKGSYKGTLTAQLQAADGTALGSTPIQVNSGKEWTRLTAQITATGNAPQGRFALIADKAGTLCLDVVSLFPPTYKNRPNGCRIDLAEKLEAMKPAFVRFPGGCFVEGIYANGETNRFEWKKTIGPIEERPGHMNQNWGYRVTDGLGFHEMLQLTEDLGAEPLFVVNMGMGHGWMEDYTQIEEYIQEALDAIEYCNGDAQTTKWGALRAKNGHPEPFNLRLIEIGNENYNFTFSDNSDQSDHYAERYYQFYKAIRAKHPEVTIIGNVEAWGTDNPSWRNPYPIDAVDEHYYRSPSWFVNQYNKYDSYSRSSHKIYVGEYAVTQDFGVNGHLTAALGEAVFMQGMENNSDVCIMNSYAPIFVNENNATWRPDMIRFNSYTSYGTPSYYVQQLFPNNVGKQNVLWTEENNTLQESNAHIGLSTWSTTATFDNVKVTTPEGTLLFSDDFASARPEWQNNGGTWSTNGGTLKQTDPAMQGQTYICNLNLDGGNYIYEVDATKNSGAEGFLIVFNYADAQNYCWWNLGGWGNTQHGVEYCSKGVKSTVTSTAGSLETGRTYHIKICVAGSHVQCYLDNALIHEFNLPVSRKIYVSSNIDDATGTLYLKLVNPGDAPQTANLHIDNATVESGSLILLSSSNGTDENDLQNPNRVTPKEQDLNVSGQEFTYEVPPYSFNILRLKVSDIQIQAHVPDEAPEPIAQFSFDNGIPTDDSGQLTAQLQGGAAIVDMGDGNQALFTGTPRHEGYLNFGPELITQVLSQLNGDYAVAIDVLLPDITNLAQYCWAFSFSKNTDKYIGLVNTAGNTNWYLTLKNTQATDIAAHSGLSYGTWHNLLYTQSGSTGRIYIDGRLMGERTVTDHPADFADELTEASLAHSPFADDALMAGTYFDNFRIYNSALTPDQALSLCANLDSRPTSAPQVASTNAREELGHLMPKFNYLHTTTMLPSTLQEGTTIAWSFEPTAEGADYVALVDNELRVNALPQNGNPLCAGILRATLSTPQSSSQTFDQRLTLAPDDNRYGYLYCFMNAAHETTNFALGTKEDRAHSFHVLLDGAEVFDTHQAAAIEHGTRDAYIGRGQDADGYFITTTDMKQQASGQWNNRGIDLLRSSDLIHWQSTSFNFTQGKQIFADPEATTGLYNTDAEYARINRVWAPQFIWDKDYNHGQGAYLVYYSVLSTNEGDTHDRIVYSYTDRQFRILTQPRLLFDPGHAVIDADIIFNPYDSLYHMFYKHEGATGAQRGIYEATSPTLTGGEWTPILHFTAEGSELVEAPTALRLINEDTYNLYYMRYSGGSAYKYCPTDHLGHRPGFATTLKGEGSFQHGSMLTLTAEEYTLLQAWSDLILYRPYVETQLAQTGGSAYALALQKADSALALTTVAELAKALPEAYQALLHSTKAYADSLCAGPLPQEGVDLTFLLTNPDFAQGGQGWNGTTFTQADAGVAEFFDKTFDTYQVLTDMPAGTYRFECQGFYRYGDYVEAYPAHQGGTEQLLARLYVNDQSTPFLSLFDGSVPYTYSPYTYPNDIWSANTAFNTDHQYTANAVNYTLTQRGTLRLGMAKSEARTHDWTCFDNFRLIYLGNDSPTGLAAPSGSESLQQPMLTDRFTPDGRLLPSDAVLPSGSVLIERQLYPDGHHTATKRVAP